MNGESPGQRGRAIRLKQTKPLRATRTVPRTSVFVESLRLLLTASLAPDISAIVIHEHIVGRAVDEGNSFHSRCRRSLLQLLFELRDACD